MGTVLLKSVGELNDVGTLRFVVGVSSAIIGLSLAIIGYLLKAKSDFEKKERKDISIRVKNLSDQQKESIDKLSSVVETVSETVNNLKIIVEVIQKQQSDAYPRTEKILDNHTREIQNINVRVTKLEERCYSFKHDRVKA